MKKPNEYLGEEWTAVSVIVSELIVLARAHPKKAALVVIFHIWCYGLVFKHLQELKSLWDLIPFIH